MNLTPSQIDQINATGPTRLSLVGCEPATVTKQEIDEISATPEWAEIYDQIDAAEKARDDAQAHLAAIQAAYADMCAAEAEGREGAHNVLIASLNAAGIQCRDKADAREIAARMVG